MAIGLQLAEHIDHSELSSNPGNRLMLAVLEEALVTFQRGVNSPKAERRRRFYEVDHWVASHDTDWPFSFENICTSLMIDPDYVRAGLQQLKEQAYEEGCTVRRRGLRRERIYARRGWRGQIK